LGTREEDAKRMGVPMIVTEFGACINTENCAAEINSILDVCESKLAGFAYW
jgi:hypothetical protein